MLPSSNTPPAEGSSPPNVTASETPVTAAPSVPTHDQPSSLVEDRWHHRAMTVVQWTSATLLIVSVGLWSWLSPSRISPDLPTTVPVVKGTNTVSQVADLTEDGRASLVQAQRAQSEHVALKIQAEGARDLVKAWSKRSGAHLGKVLVTYRRNESRCMTTVTHGKDQNHPMVGRAFDPISACRALIAGMEARYPDLAQSARTSESTP